MKKLVKFCLIASLSLLIVGSAFCIIGFSSIDFKEVDKILVKLTDGKVRIKDGIRIGINKAIESADKENVIFGVDEIGEKQKISSGQIEELKIDLGAVLLDIVESEDSYIYVSLEDAQSFDIETEDGCLSISTPQKIKEQNLILYLPATMKLDKTEINFGTGKIYMEDFCSEEVQISVGAGYLEAKDVEFGEFHVEVDAGACDIQGRINGDVSAECALGSILLDIEGAKEDYDYNIECVSGKVAVDGEEYSGLVKEKELEHGADKKMDLECAMGNIEVSFEE